MRIAYIAAGAGGMYCGSCLHDNTVAAAMQEAGHDVALLPTYTPMRTDEASVASDRLFYGAINVYLRQKSRLFRKAPRFLERLLDRPGLLRWAARRAGTTDAAALGDLTLAVLRGEEGPQAAELERLATWLRDDYRPDVVHLTNSLFLGMARRLGEATGAPVVVNVQGEDLFLDQLPERHRRAVDDEMARRAGDASLFIAPNRYYSRHMSAVLGVSERQMRVVPLGIRLDGYPAKPKGRDTYDRPRLVVGYLARICPEKGLDQLVDTFLDLHAEGEAQCELRVAGYLDPPSKGYLHDQVRRVEDAGLGDRLQIVGEIDHAGKIDFLRDLDLLSVPTAYREPKGLFALEAMAAGVPALLPDHGGFPELIQETGGGELFPANSRNGLTAALRGLLDDRSRLCALGAAGHGAVHAGRGADSMADATLAVYREVVADRGKVATR